MPGDVQRDEARLAFQYGAVARQQFSLYLRILKIGMLFVPSTAKMVP